MGGDDFNKSDKNRSIADAINLGKKHFVDTPGRLEKEADEKLDVWISQWMDECQLLKQIENAAAQGLNEITLNFCDKSVSQKLDFKCGTGGIIPAYALFRIKDESSNLSAMRTFFDFLIRLYYNFLRQSSIQVYACEEWTSSPLWELMQFSAEKVWVIQDQQMWTRPIRALKIVWPEE